MDFKKYVEKMFFEEHIAHQMEEIWKLSWTKSELFGMVGLEEVELSHLTFNSNQVLIRLLQRRARRR
jgi:hypothetical protein